MFVYDFWKGYVFGSDVAFVCVGVVGVIEDVGVVEEGVEGLDFLVDYCVCCCFGLGWREVTLVFGLVIGVVGGVTDVERCLKLNWLIVVIVTVTVVVIPIIKMTRYICFIIYVSYTNKIFLCCCT